MPRVAELLQSQALDAGTVPASQPTATPTPRLECDSPDMLAEAERDYNLNHRPAKIAYSYDILEVSREPGKLTCAALVEQVGGDHFQFDYGYQDRRGIYGSRGYRISTPTPIPEPTATATPTPTLTPAPTPTHTPEPPETAPADRNSGAYGDANAASHHNAYRHAHTHGDGDAYRHRNAHAYSHCAAHNDAYAQADGASLQPPRTGRAL